MGFIINGRTESCNNNIGGLKNAYLFDYVDYQKYLIQVNNGVLVSYPTTNIFKFELFADGNDLTVNLQEDETGISYDQSVNLTIKGYNYNNLDLFDLLNKRIGCIVELNSGKFQIIGLYNGCRVKTVKGQTGGGYTDFNGVNIEIEAKELNPLFFINDLAGAGFILDGTETFFLLQENGDYLLQENNDKIII